MEANDGKVIDSSTENKQYFVETVSNETIPKTKDPLISLRIDQSTDHPSAGFQSRTIERLRQNPSSNQFVLDIPIPMTSQLERIN